MKITSPLEKNGEYIINNPKYKNLSEYLDAAKHKIKEKERKEAYKKKMINNQEKIELIREISTEIKKIALNIINEELEINLKPTFEKINNINRIITISWNLDQTFYTFSNNIKIKIISNEKDYSVGIIEINNKKINYSLEEGELLEKLKKELTGAFIENFIHDKESWYCFDKNDGNFLWKKSLEKLSQKISELTKIEQEELKKIIENNFNEKSLTTIEDKETLISNLLKIDPNMIIWSEGDEDWQNQKIEQTDVDQLIKKENIFIAKKKTSILKEIFKLLKIEYKERVIIIDDKEENLKIARQIAKELSININTFLLKINSEENNQRELIDSLKEIKESYKKIKIISDLDRVIIDTDKAFANAIEQIINKI